MKKSNQKSIRFSVIIFCVLFLGSSSFAGRRAEEEFWSDEDNANKGATQGLTAYPGDSFVTAGLMAYMNYGKGEDDFTAGLKISSSFRDAFEFMHLRLDGFLGIDGPAEGTSEVQFSLIKGFNFGLGVNYTKRLKFSPRFGLYVEDQKDISKRAGFYLLKDSSGGIEVNWPFSEQWDVSVDVGVEKTSVDSYKRLVAGLMYKF
jgi:hypothetical protein